MNYTRRKVKIMIALITICLLVGVATNIKAHRLEDFRKMIERQPEILMRDKPTYALAVRFGVVIPNPKKVVFFFERSENNG